MSSATETAEPIADAIICPECGAANLTIPGAPRPAECWLCRRVFGAADAMRASSPATEQRPLQFGLSSLLLCITLVAIFFGLLAAAPPMAVLFFLLTLPALIRTTVVLRRRGQPATLGEKFLLLWSSAGAVFVAWVSAAGAFLAVCTAGFVGGALALESLGVGSEEALSYDLMFGAVLGAVAALLVLVGLLRFFWRARNTAPPCDEPPSSTQAL
ncbi:MAG: hypothetical protein K1X74_08200 [Pirellulales bacterium]|nr:hypothetical protein [Pirellulales bacterium]